MELFMRSRGQMIRSVRSLLLYGALVITGLFMLLPFLWMLSTSLKPMAEVFGYPPILVSENSSLQAYATLISEHGVLRSLGNSMIVATASTALQLAICTAAGYGFAKFNFAGRDKLFAILVGSIIVPFTVLMVPLYKIMRDLDWLNSYQGVIVPAAANAFSVFFLRQYISTVNDELLDAARIDGCSEFGIFTRIVVPIIRPGLISLGLILFMRAWNDYLWPLVILRTPEKFTMVILINSLVGALGDATPRYDLQMAAGIISIIPLLIIFVAFQRRFVEGITAGAVK
jgi:ABC-type glycerol-3-phosphate transport system permease component